ncbi:VOC family protein [Streptomyces sp. NEAU-YJ-81]|uniref:VOC family protein n=1 Tax=Streptomyces sp. NEAU-YJ-81 TaxID=2820288 RepID=UPI0035B3CFFB
MTHLGLVTVVVRDYDEAITFYVEVLGFVCRSETRRYWSGRVSVLVDHAVEYSVCRSR